MKGLGKILKRTALVGLATIPMMGSNSSLADECNFNLSLAQKSNYRNDSGTDSIKKPVTETVMGLSCGNFDASLFGVHNNHSGNINEIDVGVGYSFSKGDFSGRAGLTRWMYEEDGGKNDIFDLNLKYGGLPVDLGVTLTKILDDKGIQAVGKISKTFEIGKVNNIEFKLTPSFKATYLSDYFGLNGHSNDIYGISLGIMKDNVGVDIFADHHRGHLGLENDTKFGVALNYNF